MHAGAPRWSTSSDGAAADTKPLELLALGAHLHLCSGEGARRVAMHCGAVSLMGLLMSRRVSALALLAVLIGGAWLVL